MKLSVLRLPRIHYACLEIRRNRPGEIFRQAINIKKSRSYHRRAYRKHKRYRAGESRRST